MEATYACLWLILILLSKAPMTHSFGSLLQLATPCPWHCNDIATPDPWPDLIPACWGGRVRRRARAGGKFLHNIRAVLQHLEQISPEMLQGRNSTAGLHSPQVPHDQAICFFHVITPTWSHCNYIV